jgi:hypothetical protein
MAKFTLVSLYVSGSLFFLISLLGVITSFGDSANAFGRALALMTMAIVVMGLGAILETLRKIASNTSAERRTK